MRDGFAEFGISPGLTEAVARLGYTKPTSIQRAAIPVLRRGGNAVIHAAPGAGATAAYGLALLDRLIEQQLQGESTQVLVITPTEERALAAALELGRLGLGSDSRAVVQTLAWLGDAAFVVVPVAKVLSLLQSSRLKLDELKAVVLHDLSAMLTLGFEPALETLMSTVPRDAQRVLVTSELNSAVEKLVEAHARKALHVPARPALPDAAPTSAPSVQVEYRVVTSSEAPQALALIAAKSAATPNVFCRSVQMCSQLEEELKLRGIQAEVKLYGENADPDRPSIGYGTPLDHESFSAAFANGGALVIDARQLSHLRNLARQSNIELRTAPAGTPRDTAALERFRDQIRRAISEEDLAAQMLVLSPLLDEFSAAEVAAAAAALLRKRAPAPAPVSAPAAAAPSTFVKLFVSIGQRDAITARDLVGAITGEAGVTGDKVGRVEIRDTFSIVEVATEAGDKVIRALNGTSLRGRSLRVDYDRKPSGPKKAMPSSRRGRH